MRPPTIITALCIAAGTAHAASGDPDTTFGTSGRVTIDLSPAPPVTDPPTPPTTVPSEGSAISVQSDGKILVAALSAYKATILRLTDTGALDTTFNTTGKAALGFGGSRDYMRDIAFSSKGPVDSPSQIVVAGYANALSGDFTFALGRLKPDGTILGTTLSSGTRYGNGLALQTDGKVVIVGHNVIGRYTSAGVLDTAFDGDGRNVFNIDATAQVNGVAAQPDGKIIAVGTASGSPPNAFVIGRYNADGTLDTSFGTAGYVRTRVGTLANTAHRVAILPNGKILVAGSTLVPAPDVQDFALVRYLPDGTLDTTFNSTGIATASVGANDGVQTRMAVESDGRILVGGTTGLVRFNPNGTLDTSFSGDGKVPTDFVLNGIAVQPNGRIVLTGGDGKVVVMRLLSEPGPEISVEEPAGTPLISGTSTVDFGTALTGESKSRTFTVRNTGAAELTGLAVSKTAAGTPESFTLGTPPPATLAAGASATFTVSFASTTTGTRTATLNIASNDLDENPFVIQLTGLQASALEVWRTLHFGSAENSGDGADLSDPDRDGLPNLIEFATGSNPKQLSPPVGKLVQNGEELDFIYTRSKAAHTELQFKVESTTTLGTWGTDGLGNEVIIPQDATTEQVKVTFSTDTAERRFVRLRVTGSD